MVGNLSDSGRSDAAPRAAGSSKAAPLLFGAPFPAGVAFSWWGGGDGAPNAPLPEEQALLGRSPSARRVGDFTLGRHCAREALAKLEPGQEPPRAPILRTPILRTTGRAPRWPPGIVGSNTHSGGMAAAAVARASAFHGIGLDLERIGRGSERLVARILRPEERARLEALPPERREEAFAVAFAIKEGIFKALNPATGVFLGFQDAALEELPVPGAAQGELTWRLMRTCGKLFPSGFQGSARFARGGGYALCGVWLPAGPRK